MYVEKAEGDKENMKCDLCNKFVIPNLFSRKLQGCRFGFDIGGNRGHHRYLNTKHLQSMPCLEVSKCLLASEGKKETDESNYTSYITICHQS